MRVIKVKTRRVKGITGCTARKRAKNPGRPTGQWIRKDLRLAIYLRDGFRCLYCCQDLHSADPRDLTLDHVKPIADGGTNLPENLITACRGCNDAKNSKPLAVFASAQTRHTIRLHLARKINRYRKLAKAIIAGETGSDNS